MQVMISTVFWGGGVMGCLPDLHKPPTLPTLPSERLSGRTEHIHIIHIDSSTMKGEVPGEMAKEAAGKTAAKSRREQRTIKELQAYGWGPHLVWGTTMEPISEEELMAPISIERGLEIEKKLRGSFWSMRIHMQVHTLVDDYWKFVYAVTQDEKFACETPASEMVGYHALCNALDELGPTLSSLKQEQENFELQKQVFQGQARGFNSAVEEVLKLPDAIDQMLQDKKNGIMDQLPLVHDGFTKDIKESIIQEMMKGQVYLTEMVGNGKVSDKDSDACFMVDFQETKWLHGYRSRNNFKLGPHSFWGGEHLEQINCCCWSMIVRW
jgi:hypothetical protein